MLTYIIARFLLARLHVDSLLDKRTKQKVLSTLETLPKGSAAVDEAYGEAYCNATKRIDGQLTEDRSLARRALSWITYAQRLLTTKELCHVLAIEPGNKALNNDNVYDVEDVVSVCAGLVTVDEESSIIRLVHYTTQEYFERVRLDWNPGAQEEIAVACLTYLSFDTFRSSCADDKAFAQRIAENPFFDYSAHYWSEHVRPVESTTSRLALAFLCDEALVDCTAQGALTPNYKYTGYSRDFPNRTSGLHLTARYGLVYLIERLLMGKHGDSSIGADLKDGDGRTLLSHAAWGGHETMVRLLVERDDVEADSKDEHGRTPLSHAAERGHEAVVQLLAGRDDVEADSKDEDGWTPLSWAAQRGHEAIVRQLVERDDVEADSKDEYGRTPLSFAAWEGHEAVVRLLVKRDDVVADLKDSYRRTPLSLAAWAGHEAVVRLLVERDDVEADPKDKDGRTPLSWAAWAGHEAVVRLLVERDDVEADSKDKDGWTPLWRARDGHHEAVVRLLVERDDVEADLKDKDDLRCHVLRTNTVSVCI
jgi:ankyrin repeat protein